DPPVPDPPDVSDANAAQQPTRQSTANTIRRISHQVIRASPPPDRPGEKPRCACTNDDHASRQDGPTETATRSQDGSCSPRRTPSSTTPQRLRQQPGLPTLQTTQPHPGKIAKLRTITNRRLQQIPKPQIPQQ